MTTPIPTQTVPALFGTTGTAGRISVRQAAGVGASDWATMTPPFQAFGLEA